jgi:hypothetical protein
MFLGSACIYPRNSKQPLKEEYLLSGYLESTNEPYAIAKIAGIKMCENYYKQYGDNNISVMPNNLYGTNDNFDLKNSHVLPALIRKFHEAKINNEKSVEIWGSGKPKREFLHVEDLADACIFLMKKDGRYCEDIEDLAGISKKNPLLAISFLIILFSLAGIPPLAGFFAKFYVFISVIESGMYTLAIVGLLSTVISAFYYLRIIKIIYFDEIKHPFDKIKNLGITITVFLSCSILVFFFLYPSILNNIVNILSIN